MPTPNFNYPYVANGSNAGEVVHNDAINRIDGMIQLSVETFDESSVPGSPVEGQAWKAAGSGLSGAWAGGEDTIQLYVSGWITIPITVGMRLWDKANGVFMICTDATIGADVWQTREAATVAAVGALTAVSGTGDDAQVNSNINALQSGLDSVIANLKTAGLMA